MDEAKATGHRQRLKERYLKGSLDGFHDYEILEILLTYAIPRRDVKPLAKALIRRFKGLKGVFEAFEELSSIKGAGENTAMLLLLVKEAAFAYPGEAGEVRSAVRSPRQAIEVLEAAGALHGEERFLALCLNSRNEVIGVETLHTGAIDESSISARDVIEKAIKYNARSIIFVHSAGDLAPPDAVGG